MEVPETAAVYVLYADHFDKAKYGRELYVGHTDNLRSRVDDHELKKAFWTAALVFTSAGDWMDKGDSQNVEFAFIKMAQVAARYDVRNGNMGGAVYQGAHNQFTVAQYLKPIREVLTLAGIDVFEPSPDSVYTYTPSKPLRHRQSTVARLRLKGFNPPQFEMIAGSVCPVLLPDAVTQHATLPGVTYDADKRTIRFELDTVVRSDASSAGLFGYSFNRWLNEQRRSLEDVLKAGTETGDFDESHDVDVAQESADCVASGGP